MGRKTNWVEKKNFNLQNKSRQQFSHLRGDHSTVNIHARHTKTRQNNLNACVQLAARLTRLISCQIWRESIHYSITTSTVYSTQSFRLGGGEGGGGFRCVW